MAGRIESGNLVTVVPIQTEHIKLDDIVLCTVQGSDYLHIVKAIEGERYQIGNNKGRLNGWTNQSKIYGKVTAIE